MPTYQVASRQVWLNQEVRNVFYYDCNDVLGSQQGQEVADHFRAAYAAFDALAALDEGWSFYGIDLRRVDVADLPSVLITPTSGTFSGSQAVDKALPTQIAMVASLQAPTTKPRRARTYQAGMVESALNQGGTFNPAWAAAFGDFIEDVDTITVTGDTLLRVAAQWSGTPQAVTATNRLQTYVVRTNPATQRRRRQGSGI